MVLSPEILLLSDPAQGLFILEGNTDSRDLASDCRRPGVEGPFALHGMSIKQPVRSQQLLCDVKTNHVVARMHVRAEEARSANGPGKSEG